MYRVTLRGQGQKHRIKAGHAYFVSMRGDAEHQVVEYRIVPSIGQNRIYSEWSIDHLLGQQVQLSIQSPEDTEETVRGKLIDIAREIPVLESDTPFVEATYGDPIYILGIELGSKQKDMPTYMGQPTDQGVLEPVPVSPHEGYALLSCGNTEVRLSYTVLHAMIGWIYMGAVGHSTFLRDDLIVQALSAVCCEASIDRRPKNANSK